MVQYSVKDPQGIEHVIDGPEGASPEEVIAQAQKLIPTQQAPQQPQSMGLGTAFAIAGDMAPWNRLRAATLDPAGQAVAEAGGRMGYPGTGAAVGTAIQMAPELLAAGTSLQGLYNSESPIARGITNTPQEIGAQMKSGEQAAGIDAQYLPEQRGSIARFPKQETFQIGKQKIPMEVDPSVKPISYPRDTNAFLNFAKQRMEQYGNRLSPQELSDYRSIISEQAPKISWSSPQGAQAAQVRTQANQIFTKVVEGRQGLNQAYGWSKVFHPDVMGTMKAYVAKRGPGIIADAAGLATGGAIASRFFK